MRMMGDIALKLAEPQSMDVHQSSSELAVSISILISLTPPVGSPPDAPRSENFTFSMGISKELSTHWLSSPERKPMGSPLNDMRSRSGAMPGMDAPESTSKPGMMIFTV